MAIYGALRMKCDAPDDGRARHCHQHEDSDDNYTKVILFEHDMLDRGWFKSPDGDWLCPACYAGELGYPWDRESSDRGAT